MNNKSYIKDSQKKNMENYMDFNGGTAGYIQSQQQKNMENYMDFNGRNATGFGKSINLPIVVGGVIFVGIILYIIKKSK